MVIDKKAWALALATQGFAIFPLPPGGKTPVVLWQDVCTTDRERIAAWFDATPEMNYGVNPGPGQVIIDIDNKHGKQGGEAWARLEQDGGAAETFTVDTPSSGQHRYLILMDGRTVGNGHDFPKGIDVRGVSGYVVGPGSVVNGKAYVPVVDEGLQFLLEAPCPLISVAPVWVSDRLRAPGERAESRVPVTVLDTQEAIHKAARWLGDHAPAVEGDGGNAHTYVTAAKLKDFGVSEVTALELMGNGWNSRCVPPWALDELATVVQNAYRYGLQPPGIAKDEPLPGDFLSSFSVGGESGAAWKHPLADVVLAKAAFMREEDERETVIPGWLPAHGFTAVVAKYRTGKSVILVDLAMHLACDLQWHGLPVESGRTVIYLAGEDVTGVKQHLRAWERRHNRWEDDGRFVVGKVAPALINGKDSSELHAWVDYLKEMTQGRPCVVLVDTWQRATVGGSQNEDRDMQKAVAAIEYLAAELRGPAVIACHPPKHDDSAATIAGSGVIENTSTAIWTLTQETAGKRLEVKRIKGDADGQYLLLDFSVVDLGVRDKFGLARTGVVPVKIGQGGGIQRGQALAAIEEGLEQKKEMWALWLREWVKEHVAETRSLTLSAVAQQVESLSGEEKIPFITVGEKNLSRSTVLRRLRELFDLGGVLYTYADGAKLYYHNKFSVVA